MNSHQGLKLHSLKVKIAFSLEEARCGSTGLLRAFKPFDIVGIFGRNLLLRLAGGITL